MKTSLRALGGLMTLALLPLGLVAQSNSTTTTTTVDSNAPTRTTTYNNVPTTAASDVFGARAGDFEFTLGGTGVSNNDLDSSAGGLSASLGYYFTDTTEIVVRQTGTYSNPDGGDSVFDGSTRVALDQHFGTGRFRPFVGINFGGLYGESIDETWTGGLEAGLKFYVQPRTFLFALVDYAWNFKDSDDADDSFSDGRFQWTAGIGFNF